MATNTFKKISYKRAVKVAAPVVVTPEPVKEYSLQDMIAAYDDASAEIQFAREHGYSRATARRLAELEAQKELELRAKLAAFKPWQLIWENDAKIVVEDIDSNRLEEVDMAWSVLGVSDGTVDVKLAFIVHDDGTKTKAAGNYPEGYRTCFTPEGLEKKVSANGVIYWKFNKGAK
jgi:hypothetical protein